MHEGLLPALGQKVIVGEKQQILLEQPHGADQDRLLELLFDDAERHIEAIRSRLELAAGDVPPDGWFTLDAATENGLSIEIDFNVPAGNVPVAPRCYQRLHTARAVATEILAERRATLLTDPLRLVVDGVVTVDRAANLTGIERQLAQLQATLGPDEAASGDDGLGHLVTGYLSPARCTR
ncbi:hypothetical protein [Kitasatospora sp. NPDC059160]|uniref:hypothetical protein n=1 Tax=Kitasatospora sp. NPDC059160 TaxID=3346748 RepID=UPI003687816F